MKTFQIELNPFKHAPETLTKVFTARVSCIQPGVVNYNKKNYDLRNSILEIYVDSQDGIEIPKIAFIHSEKIKGAPVYARGHDGSTIGCFYYDASKDEMYVISSAKSLSVPDTGDRNTSYSIYGYRLELKNFENLRYHGEAIGINSNTVSILTNNLAQVWKVVDSDCQLPFHFLCDHFGKKRVYFSRELTHLRRNGETGKITLSLTRNFLSQPWDEIIPIDADIIANNCEYTIKDGEITISWNKPGEIEIIPKEVQRVLVNSHSLHIDPGYARIRLL